MHGGGTAGVPVVMFFVASLVLPWYSMLWAAVGIVMTTQHEWYNIVHVFFCKWNGILEYEFHNDKCFIIEIYRVYSLVAMLLGVISSLHFYHKCARLEERLSVLVDAKQNISMRWCVVGEFLQDICLSFKTILMQQRLPQGIGYCQIGMLSVCNYAICLPQSKFISFHLSGLQFAVVL